MKKRYKNKTNYIVSETINKYLKEQVLLEYIDNTDADRLRDIIEELIKIKDNYSEKLGGDRHVKVKNDVAIYKFTEAINALIVATDRMDAAYIPYTKPNNLGPRSIDNRSRNPEAQYKMSPYYLSHFPQEENVNDEYMEYNN